MGKIPDVRVDNLDEVTRNTPVMSKIYLFSKNGHFFSVGLQGLRIFSSFFLSNNIPGG